MKVKVGEKSIGTCYFKEAYPQMVYEDGKPTDEQEMDEKGIIPMWRVKVEVTQDGRTSEMLTVSVPLERNPAEGLQLNEEVVFIGLFIESGNRKTGGRWERLGCDGIVRKKRGTRSE